MRSKFSDIPKLVIVTIFSSLLFSGCSQRIGQVQEDLDLLGVLGLSKDDGWILLKNPDEIWKIGSVMVFSNSGKADWETNINEEPFSCIPKKYIVPSSTPQIERGKTVNYGINIENTLGFSESEIASSTISIGAEEKPEYVSTISLTEVLAKRLNRGATNKYIKENYKNLGSECQNYINSANSYIVGETYTIKNGTIGITTATGAKVDLSGLEKEVIDAGYSLDSNGSIKIVDKNVVVAIRPADFSDTLKEIGVEPKSKVEKLQKKLVNSNDAIALGITPSTLWLWGGIAVSTAVIISSIDDGGSSGSETVPTNLNIRSPSRN